MHISDVTRIASNIDVARTQRLLQMDKTTQPGEAAPADSTEISRSAQQISQSLASGEAGFSRISNANMAEQGLQASSQSIVQQTSVAMLAQAIKSPEVLLELFK